MSRFFAGALVVALVLVGVPGVSVAEEDTTTTTAVTTTTTTPTTTTSTTTTTVATPTTTTTVAPPPPSDTTDPGAIDVPPEGDIVGDEPIGDGDGTVGDGDEPIEDPEGDVEDPADDPRVPKNQVIRINVTKDFVFPVAGINYYYPGFGACRDDCEREHHGIDIMTYGWKGVPVVAAHDGTIRKVRDDREWCIIEVQAADGWYTRYVHLNNDTPGYDDQDYECTLPGIKQGARVEAGQIIGWIGDSGNAEWTAPHVHFELRMPNGYPVDPYKSLKNATHIDFQRVSDDDPIATAARIATYSYGNGSGIVNLMAATDYAAIRAGGFAALDLSGPLLLSESDRLSDATVAAIETLEPNRVVVFGDALDLSVIDQLEARFSIVARAPLPPQISPSTIEPDKGVDVANVIPERSPFTLVVVGDRSRMSDATNRDLAEAMREIPSTVLETAEPAGRIGRNTYQGPGRSGTRNVLYYPTGDSYTRIRARETPDTPPDYGVIVVDGRRMSAATVAFLKSLAGLPVMPLWR